MTPKGGETAAQFEARRRTKLQQLAGFDDDTRNRFFDLMQPLVPAVPTSYFMNTAYLPVAYNVATAMQCAMAFARGCALPNDRVTAFNLMEGGGRLFRTTTRLRTMLQSLTGNSGSRTVTWTKRSTPTTWPTG